MTTRRKPADDGKPAAPEGQDNVWLAGLGAWAQAQARGTEAFDALVREGLAQQAKARQAAEAELSKAAERWSALTAGASSAPWDRLGGIFEGRVQQALARLGLPQPELLNSLMERVAALEARVAELERGTPAAPAPRASTRGARRKTGN